MYYIINKITRQGRESDTPFNVDENIQPPDPEIQLKRTDSEVKPAFNPATQKLVYQFTDNDATKTRNFAWAVVALSQAEIDANTEAQQDETARQAIKAEYLALKNGTGTTAERAARLERAVAWLLRQAVKN
jgi:hypothetical protein